MTITVPDLPAELQAAVDDYTYELGEDSRNAAERRTPAVRRAYLEEAA